MRKFILVLITVLLLAGLAAPAAAQDGSTPTATPDPLSLADVCRSAVDGVRALKTDLQIPKHFQDPKATRLPSDFDANQYFTVLDHIKLLDGYALDYLYDANGLGGFPDLYVRPVDQKPYPLYTDTSTVPGLDKPYLDSIQTDDTAAGYLQLAVLSIMGGQFYLEWHANYNDSRVVCDPAELEQILTLPNDFDQMIPLDVQRAAGDMNVMPVIEMGEKLVKVQIVTFTKWGGFMRVTYTISRDFPRTTFEAKSELLVAYQCGVMF